MNGASGASGAFGNRKQQSEGARRAESDRLKRENKKLKAGLEAAKKAIGAKDFQGGSTALDQGVRKP